MKCNESVWKHVIVYCLLTFIALLRLNCSAVEHEIIKDHDSEIILFHDIY